MRFYDHKESYARDQQSHRRARDIVYKRALRTPERLNHRDLQHEYGIQSVDEVEVAQRLYDKSAALRCFWKQMFDKPTPIANRKIRCCQERPEVV